jgi:hypothetical protein
MNKNEFIFVLDDTEKIVVPLSDILENIFPCEELPVIFYQEMKKLILRNDFINETMQKLSALLKKLLKNKLPLHESITKDIGFLWNEELQNKPGLAYTKLEGRDHWVGQLHLLWCTSNTRPSLVTWLYNDHEGSIILEITPSYPWHHLEPRKGETFIPYEQFMETYKPVLIRKIPIEVAQKWLQQAEEILCVLEDNRKRYEREHECDA